MAESWGFSVGNVRAKETSLLSSQDVAQMAAFTTEQQLTAFLQDKGYGNGSQSAELDQLLKAATKEIWEYAMSVSADSKVFYPLLYDNDFHNLKVVIKGVLSGREYSHLVLKPSVIDIGVMETAVKEKKFNLLPTEMSDAVKKAYEVLAHTSDAQLADGILDKCYMQVVLNAAERLTFVKEYITEKVFYQNVKTALRAAKAQKDAQFLREVLYLPFGDQAELVSAVLSGQTQVLEWLKTKLEFGGNEAAESFEKSPSNFEKFVDDRLMLKARRGKFITLGPEVLIGYVIFKLAEIRAVSMIASGIRTSSGEAAIRERLRMLYD